MREVEEERDLINAIKKRKEFDWSCVEKRMSTERGDRR